MTLVRERTPMLQGVAVQPTAVPTRRPSGRAIAALMIAAAPVLFIGCLGLDSAPGLFVDASVLVAGQALEDEARVAGGNGTVQVRGNIVGRLPCDWVSADVKKRNSRLDVVVTMNAGINACNGIPPTTFNYIVNVLSVKRGTYTVRVEHRHIGIDRPDGIVLETEVEVG